MAGKIRWGIIGLGNIASKFAEDLVNVDDAELTAVASRSENNAREFAAKFNAGTFFTSYSDLYNSEEVDVVYIAVPHSFHAHESIEAMRSGKHVLCEKPLGISASEIQKMIEVANEEQCFLMEAMWSRFNPSIEESLSKIANGELGTLRYINADFGFFAMERERSGRLFNPQLGGGSLLDIGIYPVFLAYVLLGKPLRIEASALFLDNGVEYQSSIRFDYEKAHANLFSSFACNTEMRAEISGELGTIFLEPRWHEASGFSIRKGDKETKFERPLNGRGYTYEIMEVNRCLQEGKLQSDKWSLKHSLHLAELLDTISKTISR